MPSDTNTSFTNTKTEAVSTSSSRFSEEPSNNTAPELTTSGFLSTFASKLRSHSRSPSPCPTQENSSAESSSSLSSDEMAKHSSGQRTFSSSSTASASSTASSPTSPTSPTSVEMKRQSSSGSNVSNRSDWERYSIGRHSNDVSVDRPRKLCFTFLANTYFSGFLAAFLCAMASRKSVAKALLIKELYL
jgi:hypothetical protein